MQRATGVLQNYTVFRVFLQISSIQAGKTCN